MTWEHPGQGGRGILPQKKPNLLTGHPRVSRFSARREEQHRVKIQLVRCQKLTWEAYRSCMLPIEAHPAVAKTQPSCLDNPLWLSLGQTNTRFRSQRSLWGFYSLTFFTMVVSESSLAFLVSGPSSTPGLTLATLVFSLQRKKIELTLRNHDPPSCCSAANSLL